MIKNRRDVFLNQKSEWDSQELNQDVRIFIRIEGYGLPLHLSEILLRQA